MPDKPRVEIVFRKGKPVAVFLHLKADVSGRTGRTIPIRPPMTAHYDDAGHPVGLELPLPMTLTTAAINEALRELGSAELSDGDLLGVRMG